MAGRRLLHSPSLQKTQPGAPDATESPRHARRLFLIGLGLWTLLFTTSSAFIYMEQARIVHASITGSAGRTAFFARIDLLVNIVGLVSQVFLTSRVLALLGVGGAAAMLPAVTLAGAIVLFLKPTITTLLWFQVVRRAVDYAVARPSREIFYTVVDRSEMLRAKGFIDMAVYRAGDAAGAWAYGLLASLPVLSASTQLAIVPLSAVWFLLSLGLGRAMHAQHNGQNSDCFKVS